VSGNRETLLEEGQTTTGEAYRPRSVQILATQIRLTKEQIPEPLPPSCMQTVSQRISLIAQDLEDIRTDCYRRIQLHSQEEARYTLQQWREAAKPKQETPVRKIVIRRDRNVVRE
jgi:hypothetical protein